jgi:hypothetical protein
MSVFVEGSAEAIVAQDVQPIDTVGICDGCRDRTQWGGLVQALVRAVEGVVDLELAQDVHEVASVPDQDPVQEFTAAGEHLPLYNRVHARHPDTGQDDLDAGIV